MIPKLDATDVISYEGQIFKKSDTQSMKDLFKLFLRKKDAEAFSDAFLDERRVRWEDENLPASDYTNIVNSISWSNAENNGYDYIDFNYLHDMWMAVYNSEFSGEVSFVIKKNGVLSSEQHVGAPVTIEECA